MVEILRRAQRLRVISVFRTADVGFIISSLFFLCFLLGVIVLFALAVALQLYVGCYINIAGRKPVSRICKRFCRMLPVKDIVGWWAKGHCAACYNMCVL